MSLSGSTAEDYNKTGDGQLRFNDAVPPEPTPENPGGVAPQVGSVSAQPGAMPGAGAAHDDDPRNIFGNPNVFRDAFGQLSSSFSSAIAVVEGELPSGLGTKAKNLIDRLREMQAEVDGWRQGKPLEDRPSQEHNEDVTRQSKEQTGGLYND